MALFLFTEAMLAGRPIRVFNQGRMRRDFTYIDDIVEGVRRVVDLLPAPDPAWSGAQPDPGTSRAPYRLYNIGNHRPVELMHLIATLERALGVAAVKELLPMQPGDVPATYADIADLTRATGFTPATPIEAGRRAVRALVPRRVAQDRRLSRRVGSRGLVDRSFGPNWPYGIEIPEGAVRARAHEPSWPIRERLGG